jgi:predicted ATPase
MIRTVQIRNFRCFLDRKIENCGRVNVIVGDNGSGKTTLLEALFFALANTSELAARFRQQRGLEGHFAGPVRKIEEGIWRDLFHGRDWSKTISIELAGNGPEARSVHISRGSPQLSIPFSDEKQEHTVGSVSIMWKDSSGQEHLARPKVSKAGFEFEGTDEDLPDFFYFAANNMPSSGENAGRLSELRQSGRASEFTKVFTNEYDWIEDLTIEVMVGAPVIFVKLKDSSERMPLPLVSGGINRIIGVMLAIASRSKTVVLVDEMEDGIYYRHHESIWRAILAMARNCDSQLFVTTHSDEWIRALIRAAGNNVDDIALWRTERGDTRQPDVFLFKGAILKDGIEYGAEIRGGSE